MNLLLVKNRETAEKWLPCRQLPSFMEKEFNVDLSRLI